MRHKTTQTLYAYWNDVRDGRLAPRRFDIEPARISSVLPDTFMLERLGASLYRFRLAGTRICDLFRAEFRGVDFLDGWSPADAAVIGRLLVEISDGGAGLLEVEGRDVAGETVTLEILLLPLVHTQGTVDRFLGSVTPLAAPAWLGRERIVFKRLTRHEIIWPDGRPHALVNRAQRQVPFLPHVRNARIVRQERRQFRVYDGGLSGTPSDKS